MRMRTRERDKAAQALQQALAAKEKLLAEVRELEAETQYQITLRSQASLGQVDLSRVIDAQRYQLTLAERIHGIHGNIAIIDSEVEKRRAKLVVCEQGVKALEKLEEHQLHAWQTEQFQQGQARLDEWASFRHFQRHAES